MKRTHRSFDLIELENTSKKYRCDEIIYETECLSEELGTLSVSKVEEMPAVDLNSFMMKDFSTGSSKLDDHRVPVVVFKDKKCVKETKLRDYPIYLLV